MPLVAIEVSNSRLIWSVRYAYAKLIVGGGGVCISAEPPWAILFSHWEFLSQEFRLWLLAFPGDHC